MLITVYFVQEIKKKMFKIDLIVIFWADLIPIKSLNHFKIMKLSQAWLIVTTQANNGSFTVL